MYGLAQIYTGCKCGETWRTVIGQTEDIENDEIYMYPYCTVCGGNSLTEKKNEDGTPCLHAVTEDEHRSIIEGCNDENFYDDE